MGKITTIFKERVKIKKKNEIYVDYDIDEINRLIYNDLPINYHNEEDARLERIIKKMLMKGEYAKLITEVPTDSHWITSYGRVLNAKRTQQMTISHVRNDYLAFFVVSKRWKLQHTMERYGFKYDKEQLLQFYEDINYPIRKQATS